MSPARNASMVLRRTGCGMSPWSGSTATRSRRMVPTSSSTVRLRLQNTSADSTAGFPSRVRSVRSFSLARQWMTDWSTSSVVAAGGATDTRAGRCRKRLAIRPISGGMVADSIMVCRRTGSFATMLSMSGMKPMSSMRSASSMTSISTPISSSAPRSKRSSRRPGVAIMMSTGCAARRIWGPMLTPPMKSSDDRFTCAEKRFTCSWTWRASSRTGSRISARGIRARARPPASRSIIGSVNAAVLPVPVCAVARTSRRSSASGIAACWTGVGVVKRASRTARWTGSESRN